jgi:hypothetical protein
MVFRIVHKRTGSVAAAMAARLALLPRLASQSFACE